MGKHDHTVSMKAGEAREGHELEKSGAPAPIDEATGQHGDHWVLSEEERARGFVRPVRRSYVHVGIRPEYPTRPLTSEELTRHAGAGYLLYEKFPPEESPRTGRFWTKERLESGCNTVTQMPQAIAETWARDPSFYGSTFCASCRRYIVVDEFVWDDGSGQRLGS